MWVEIERGIHAEIDGDTITIFDGEHWAGAGRLVGGRIVDCAAQFGTPTETEEVYSALEDAIAAREEA